MTLLFLSLVLVGTTLGAMHPRSDMVYTSMKDMYQDMYRDIAMDRANMYIPPQDRSDVYKYMEDPMGYVYVRPNSDQRPMSPMPFQPMEYVPTTYHHNGPHYPGDGHDHSGKGKNKGVTYHEGPHYPGDGHDHGGKGKNKGVTYHEGPHYPGDGHNHGEKEKKGGFVYHQGPNGHLHQPAGSPDFPANFDTPSYQLVQQYPEIGVEERHYSSQNWVCTRAEVDTGADPLAGLESFPPAELLMSDRYQEGPQGIMHIRLRNYTQGENVESEVIAETRPISIHHWITEKTDRGNMEVQEMCFYLQHKYQDNYQPGQQGQKIPQPINPEVYVVNMPAITVYVQSFNQVAVTEAAWDYQRQQLEEKLFRMGKQYKQREFFAQCYSVLSVNTNRRSEVWIQKLDSSIPAISAVNIEVDPQDKESYLPHSSDRIITSHGEAKFRHDLGPHSHGDKHEDHHHGEGDIPHDHSHEDHHNEDHTHVNDLKPKVVKQ